MRILSLDLPQSAMLDNGLGRIFMNHLGPVVVLAGPNGSGKSRLLNKIRALRQFLLQNRQDIERRISNAQQRSARAASETEKEPWTKEIRTLSAMLGSLEATKISGNPAELHCLDWVPKNVSLADPNGFSKGSLISTAKQCENLGLDHLASGALARIQSAQDSFWEVTHQHYKGTNREETISAYESLKRIVEDLLGTEVERDDMGRLLLFGRTAAEAGLSEGQKVLLQFAVALEAQGSKLEHTIILMDEPENHLHPAAIVEVMGRIQQSVGDGQIWIATHSLPLIAQFDPEAIWYMENGTVSHAGKTPEKVIKGLLGGKDRSSRLSAFVDLPAQFALYQFAYECLAAPGTAVPESGDPQMSQAEATLRASGCHRILDYGAGTGRLAATLAEAENAKASQVRNAWDYVALDEKEKDRAACEAAIDSLCGSHDDRWFNDCRALLDTRGESTFDMLVMCNVLHEIDPSDWLHLFKEGGVLRRLVTNDGFLLIIEDHRMPTGEKAHAKGFLVLGTHELRKLFSLPPEDQSIIVCESPRRRLKAHRIPAKFIGNVSENSRREALQLLRDRAKEEILKLRSKPADSFEDGQLHAFWVQQLANATLALDQ